MQSSLMVLCATSAVLSTAMYAGAALHVALIQYPAYSRVGAEAALVQWMQSFQHAPLLHPIVAAVGCMASLLTSALGGGSAWNVAAALIGFVVPFTLVVMPAGRSLFGPDSEPHSAETRRLVKEWASMHNIRTALSLAAALLMLWQSLQMLFA
jgi:hypothetical protein